MKRRAVLAVLLVALTTRATLAQDKFSGQAAVSVITFPDKPRDPETRSRVFAGTTFDAGPHVRFRLGGFAEGLLSRFDGESLKDGVLEVDEASAQITFSRIDLLAGFTRATWGRLDEVQPSDVINPLDFSKFFFDSREAARMSVGLLRGRVHLSEAATIELIAVPRFREGRFDRLDEPTSPFNPVIVPHLRVSVTRPSDGVWDQWQGGGRFSASTGRVDWAVGVYRGFRPIPVYTLSYELSGLPAAPVAQLVIEGIYPRFNMIGGDFETAFTKWALRGEVAVSDEDSIQARGTPVSASGHAMQAGIGADRSIAGYRVMAELVWREARHDMPSLPYDPLTGAAPVFEERSVSTVGIVERRFARDTRLLRAFGIYDPSAKNGFMRGVGAISLREGLWLEGSGAWFSGSRNGFLGPFVDSDFASVRLLYDF